MEYQVRYLAFCVLLSITSVPSDLPDDVICDIPIYADDTTLYSKCDQASNLWQQLELVSEFESDLRDTVDWGRKWLADFNTGKTQLVLLVCSNSTSLIDVKMDGSVLNEKSSLKMLWLNYSSELDTLTSSLLLKLPPRKLESWFVLKSSILLRLLCMSIILPYTCA